MFDFFKKKKKQEENLSEQDTNITEEKLSEEEEFAQNETNSEHAKDSEKQDTLKEENELEVHTIPEIETEGSKTETESQETEQESEMETESQEIEQESEAEEDTKKEEDSEVKPEKEKGFFSRLKEGLTKTRNSINASFNQLFSGFSTIDDDFYDELEETLIMADLGLDTTERIIENLKELVKKNHIKEVEACRELVINIIKEHMLLDDSAYDFENQ